MVNEGLLVFWFEGNWRDLVWKVFGIGVSILDNLKNLKIKMTDKENEQKREYLDFLKDNFYGDIEISLKAVIIFSFKLGFYESLFLLFSCFKYFQLCIMLHFFHFLFIQNDSRNVIYFIPEIHLFFFNLVWNLLDFPFIFP